jgi:multidrug resistance efflux pump
MQTTVYAPVSGKVTGRPVQIGETVDAKDLLMILSPAT